MFDAQECIFVDLRRIVPNFEEEWSECSGFNKNLPKVLVRGYEAGE